MLFHKKRTKKIKTYADTTALPPDYQLPSAHSRLDYAEKACSNFLSRVHPDYHNGNFYDHRAEEECQDIVANLNLQHEIHKQSITLIEERNETDQLIWGDRLECLQECLQDCNIKLQKAEALLERYNIS